MNLINGILPIYKPKGITSYDVIRKFKKETGFKGKIGHAGTLDPFAEGVLLLLLNKATKKFDEIQKWQKVYRAVAVMGASSDTLDITGKIVQQENCPAPSLETIEFEARSLVGELDQVVPSYSAAKHKGVPLYKLAREGKKVPQKIKEVVIYHISIKRYEFPELEFEADVSSGTYVRQLSYDLLKNVGVESYLKELTRLAIGQVNLEQVCRLDTFNNGSWKEFIIPINE